MPSHLLKWRGGHEGAQWGEILSLKCVFIPEGIKVDIDQIKFGVQSSKRYALIVKDIKTGIKDYLTNFTGAIVLVTDEELKNIQEALEEEGKEIVNKIPVSAKI